MLTKPKKQPDGSPCKSSNVLPVHFSPMDENEVALCALDVHGLFLVLEGDVLPEVGPAEERVAAEVADEVLGHGQAHLVSLVHLLVPKCESVG